MPGEVICYLSGSVFKSGLYHIRTFSNPSLWNVFWSSIKAIQFNSFKQSSDDPARKHVSMVKKIISNFTHAQTNLLKTRLLFLHSQKSCCIRCSTWFTISIAQISPGAGLLPALVFLALHFFFPLHSPLQQFYLQIIHFSMCLHQHPSAQDMRFQSLILAFRSLHSYILTYTSNCMLFKLAKLNQSLPDPLWAAL